MIQNKCSKVFWGIGNRELKVHNEISNHFSFLCPQSLVSLSQRKKETKPWTMPLSLNSSVRLQDCNSVIGSASLFWWSEIKTCSSAPIVVIDWSHFTFTAERPRSLLLSTRGRAPVQEQLTLISWWHAVKNCRWHVNPSGSSYQNSKDTCTVAGAGWGIEGPFV